MVSNLFWSSSYNNSSTGPQFWGVLKRGVRHNFLKIDGSWVLIIGLWERLVAHGEKPNDEQKDRWCCLHINEHVESWQRPALWSWDTYRWNHQNPPKVGLAIVGDGLPEELTKAWVAHSLRKQWALDCEAISGAGRFILLVPCGKETSDLVILWQCDAVGKVQTSQSDLSCESWIPYHIAQLYWRAMPSTEGDLGTCWRV